MANNTQEYTQDMACNTSVSYSPLDFSLISFVVCDYVFICVDDDSRGEASSSIGFGRKM